MTSGTLQRPKWLSVKEVALRLGIHEQSVRRKIAAGEIPALQLGGPGCALRVLEDELERWLYADPAVDFSGTSPQPVSPERRAPTVEGQSTAPVRSGPEEAA